MEGPRKRGRKKLADEIYLDECRVKIAELAAILRNAKANGIDVQERKRLRNQKSALESRMNKKIKDLAHLDQLQGNDGNLAWIQNMMVNFLQDEHSDILQKFTHEI